MRSNLIALLPCALGATVMNSTITYAVDGRQYVAVVNGDAVFGPPRRLAAPAGI